MSNSIPTVKNKIFVSVNNSAAFYISDIEITSSSSVIPIYEYGETQASVTEINKKFHRVTLSQFVVNSDNSQLFDLNDFTLTVRFPTETVKLCQCNWEQTQLCAVAGIGYIVRKAVLTAAGKECLPND